MASFLLEMIPGTLLYPSWVHLYILFLAVLCSLSLLTNKKRAKNLPPSPPGLPILGNLHQLGKLPHRSLWKLSQKYGHVMLLKFGSIPALVVSSPETAKEVLKTHDLDCCSRPLSKGSNKLSYNLIDISFSPYDSYWREIRKITILEVFSVKRVHHFQFVRDQEVATLIQKLNKVTKNKSPVNINQNIFDVMNNTICKIAFGKSYEGKQFQNYFEKQMDEAMAMLNSFWISDFFPLFGNILDKVSGMHNRLEKCFLDFDAFFERVIDEHVDHPTRPKPERDDIIDILLELSRDKSAPVRLTKDHIKAISFNMLVGATDTSSLTMIWAMSELARNPRVMKKVQAEIRSKVGKKPMVEVREIESLKYLNMVVKETFRLHPPATLLLPRETMRHCTIGGYDIAAKTRVLVNVWAIGRDPATWENPQEFYPERFEDSDINWKGNHYELLPFGAGRRICPGLAMGAMSVEFILANLLHGFDWELPNGTTIEDISMDEEAGLTVHKKLPLMLVPIEHKW
ncbi:hypothetical protein Leryth_003364 [Lithospermum erythrorhizon]|uniref:Oxygenase n=1 Tax=Lithospermum erythrorhizon TaxID=34254 RepID=A0AAV3R8Z0_LITER|nr:hypothetical protein Leryth_003364 [Lithospermum erythrorhizon]